VVVLLLLSSEHVILCCVVCLSFFNREYGQQEHIYPLLTNHLSYQVPGWAPSPNPRVDVETQDLISGPKGRVHVQYRIASPPVKPNTRQTSLLLRRLGNKTEYWGK
jgi:hypothetical protein